MNTSIEPSQIVFLLGAGASVEAGVPDTFSFVNEFIEHLPSLNKDLISRVVTTLKGWKKTEIDVELLLETLTKIQNTDEEPILQFLENSKFSTDIEEMKSLPLTPVTDLKDFIKLKGIVSEEKIHYLQPLLEFVEELRPLDIISVNYDTCIEQFCNVHKLSYQDGFDVNWNTKNFNIEYTDIRLYKLHGSIMWYQTDRGSYIKVPYSTTSSRINLITGETAQNLMLYPMQKQDYAEPILELSVFVKNLLEAEKCKFLIVVGYSFRDDHIKRMLWDAARKNKELFLILIDPKCYQIYNRELRFYDKLQLIPSSLDGRVVCLPYYFGQALPYLKNHFIKELRKGIGTETEARHQEIQGVTQNWIPSIKHLIKAEFVEKVEKLITSKIGNDVFENDTQLALEMNLVLGANLMLCDSDDQRGRQYLEEFKGLLRLIITERFEVGGEGLPNSIYLKFNTRRSFNQHSYYPVHQLKEILNTFYYFCSVRRQLVKKFPVVLEETKKIIERLLKYLDQFANINNIQDYINLRKGYHGFPQGLARANKDVFDFHRDIKKFDFRSFELSIIEKEIFGQK